MRLQLLEAARRNPSDAEVALTPQRRHRDLQDPNPTKTSTPDDTKRRWSKWSKKNVVEAHGDR